jgi:hypothetical protein
MPQSGHYWRARLHIASRDVDGAIHRLARIAAEERRPDNLEADAKADLAERITGWIIVLQAVARDLDTCDLDS